MTTAEHTSPADFVQWVKPGRQPLPRLYYRPIEIAAITGLGKSKVYDAIASGELRSYQVDKARLVSIDDIRRWIEGDPEDGEE